MNEATRTSGTADGGRKPFGQFLDSVPSAFYVAAHVMFMVVGLWLWSRANDHALPYSASLVLYVLSQVGFFAYFAHLITMKTAVLVEQSLICGMVLLIVLKATA